MNLVELSNVLTTANVANMDKIVIKATPNGNTVHGISPDEKIVLFSPISGSGITDKDVGIHRVGALISRLKLVDFSHSKVDVVEDESNLKAMTVKQGRKKFDYTFADPQKIRHPQRIQQDDIKSEVTLSAEQVGDILSAVNAMNPEKFTLEGRDGDILVNLFDGNSDYFEDKIGENTAGEWKRDWDEKSVTRLLKHAIKGAEEINLKISNHGFLYLNVSGITFMVVPEVQR